jgi:hypothetical protein
MTSMPRLLSTRRTCCRATAAPGEVSAMAAGSPLQEFWP